MGDEDRYKRRLGRVWACFLTNLLLLLRSLSLHRASVDEHPTRGSGGQGEGDDQAQAASAPLRGIGAHEEILASRQCWNGIVIISWQAIRVLFGSALG